MGIQTFWWGNNLVDWFGGIAFFVIGLVGWFGGLVWWGSSFRQNLKRDRLMSAPSSRVFK